MSEERECQNMKIEVHLYFHQDSTISSQLQQISQKLDAVKIKEDQMDADIQAIIDQATKNEDAETAAQAALVALFAKLQAAIAATGSLSAADRTALQAKVTEMSASAAAVSAAIVANTPAA
jgi:hypothetical protein